MAIGRILNSGHFITEFLFKKQLEWEHPGEWDNVKYPTGDSLFDARFLGYHSTSDLTRDGASIYQNCVGWAFGINECINPAVSGGKVRIKSQQDDVIAWIKYMCIHNNTSASPSANEIIKEENSFKVYSARIDDADDMIKKGTLQYIPNGNQYEDYDPKENDVVVYCGEDSEGEQSYVQHVSLYFDINSVYGDPQGRKKGEQGYASSFKWTSKMGDSGLIQHELAMLEKTYIKSTAKYLLKSRINFLDMNYGKVEFLITSA